jgi:hypothetical protein
MSKIGLALSGGGFRASLYHLGLVRFLRDAGILSRVTHITSVSGGSVLAAHLVLNWDRYNGSQGEFDAAATTATGSSGASRWPFPSACRAGCWGGRTAS